MGTNTYNGHPPKQIIDNMVKPYFMEFDSSTSKAKYLDNVMFTFVTGRRHPISIDISSDTMTKDNFESALSIAKIQLSNVTDLKWSDSVLSIDSNTFEDMSRLSSVIGPYESQTKLPSDLFLNMPAIQNVEIFQDAQLSANFDLDSAGMEALAKISYAAVILSSESARSALSTYMSVYAIHQLFDGILSREWLDETYPLYFIDVSPRSRMLRGGTNTPFGKLSFNGMDFGPSLNTGFGSMAGSLLAGTFGLGDPPYTVESPHLDYDNKEGDLIISSPIKMSDGEGNEIEIDQDIQITLSPGDGPYADVTIHVDLPITTILGARIAQGLLNLKSKSKLHIAPNPMGNPNH